MNLNDFVVPQRGPDISDYNLQRFKIQDTFSDELKRLLNSTTNISNASDPILTPQKIFISDEELNKTLSSIKKTD